MASHGARWDAPRSAFYSADGGAGASPGLGLAAHPPLPAPDPSGLPPALGDEALFAFAPLHLSPKALLPVGHQPPQARSPASLASISPTLSAVSASPGFGATRTLLPSPGLGPSPGLAPSPHIGSSPSLAPSRTGSSASSATLYSPVTSATPAPRIPGGSNIVANNAAAGNGCRFFSEGQCKFGEACRFAHSLPAYRPHDPHDRPPTYPGARPQYQMPMAAAMPRHAQPPPALVAAQRAADERNRHMFGKPPPQQIYFGRKIQKTCRFWMRGTCRFGDTCRYLHEHSPSEPARMTPRAFLAREGGIDHFVQSLDEREKERLRRLLAADGAQDYPQPEHEYSLRPLRGHEQPEHDYQLRAQRASDEAYLRALDADAEALLQRAGAAEYLQQRAEAAEYLRALDAEYLRPGEGYLARQELPPRRPSSDDLELPASFAGLALSSDEAGSEGSSPLPPAEEGHWEWTPEGWGR